MIGPGTGVAPYRAFLQERLSQKKEGGNWLFFGERQKAFDFYYEDFFSSLEKEGFLRLNCAFSRDQKEKIYVQDLIKKEEDDLWEWIQKGAIVYICGDAKKMAKDVLTTFEEIIRVKKGLSETDAKLFLRNLRKTKKLLLDIY
jgi:sulfite reductase (NADPH) flavoprotein alpha-component